MHAQIGTPLTAALLGCVAILLDATPSSYFENPQELTGNLQRSLHPSRRLRRRGHWPVISGCVEVGQPLSLAALIGSKRIVKLLLDRQVSMHAQAGLWKTALHAAIQGGNPDNRLTTEYCSKMEQTPIRPTTGSGRLSTLRITTASAMLPKILSCKCYSSMGR